MTSKPLAAIAASNAPLPRFRNLLEVSRDRDTKIRFGISLPLAGAKREADVRFVLTDLFSRGGTNSVLRKGWSAVLPVLRKDWQLARDLGLLALASYAGREADNAQTDSTNPLEE